MPSDPIESFAHQVERLFQAALDVPQLERAGFVVEKAGADHRLASSVNALLRAVATERSPWTAGAFSQEAKHLADDQDARLDRYQLEERIGVGGMGVVYKAVRSDDEFAKRVAIKIVQWESGEARLAERFRTERQIQAGLEHPNIARMLDGGTTEDGRPFLVMEYIEGVSLDKYLSRNAFSTKAKLLLFRKICDAVACAHRNLVVHRDLKPSNILVTEEGEPKLLDFGIAKLLDGQAKTETGYGAMTPRYASPEQISNGPITTSSDIYSLGVILYEMLSGASPYAAASALELAQSISSAAPPPMAKVDRDLEMVVRKALRKEPARRYASIEQFSADLLRYLEGFPVAAQADTLVYRARKFVVRNRAYVAAGTLVVLALAGGIVSTARQAQIANRRFNDVRKLANSYLFELNDAIEALPGSTAARQLLAKRAQEYLDSLAKERVDDPGLLKELAVAYEKLADVQGRREQANIGDVANAKENFRKALTLREQLYRANPGDTPAAVDLAHSLLLMGNDELARRRLEAAETYCRRAIAVMERSGDDAAVRHTHGVALQILGDVLGHPRVSSFGRTEQALALYERALGLFEQNQREAPKRMEKGVFIGATLSRISYVRQTLKQGPAAIADFRRAYATYHALSLAEPTQAFYRLNAAVRARELAVALMHASPAGTEAKALMAEAIQTIETLARQDPNDVSIQAQLADTFVARGLMLAPSAALDRLGCFERAIAMFEEIEMRRPGSLKPDASLTARQLRTGTLLSLGRYQESIESAKRELEIDDALLVLSSANAFAIRNREIAASQIAKALEEREK